MSPARASVRKQHRPIDLQRVFVDERLVYQSLCACGRRAEPGSRQFTEKNQSQHRRLVLAGVW